jgi:hypothetical protein
VWARLLALSACIAVLCACNDTPGGPNQVTQLTVTGRWIGDLAVQDVTGRMTWTLVQTGTSVTGPVLISLPTGTVLLNGTLTGMLDGTSLPYTITVAPNGVPNQPTCTGQLGGTMTVTTGSVPTMTGPIAIMSSNCTILFTTRNFTLTKQTVIGQ